MQLDSFQLGDGKLVMGDGHTGANHLRLQAKAARSGGLGSGVWGGTHEDMNIWHMEVLGR